MKYTAKKEVSEFDLKQKFLAWKVPKECYENIIKILKEEQFIDNQRFAKAFIHDKFIFNKWGKRKIKLYLLKKQIPENIIEKAFDQVIDNKEYLKTAENLLLLKLKSIKEEQTLKIKAKIFNFLANKGFEPEIIYKLIEKHLK